jgi:hypothetical protein
VRSAQGADGSAPGGGRQLALFELKADFRPAAERTAAGRYLEPDLLGVMAGAKERG